MGCRQLVLRGVTVTTGVQTGPGESPGPVACIHEVHSRRTNRREVAGQHAAAVEGWQRTIWYSLHGFTDLRRGHFSSDRDGRDACANGRDAVTTRHLPVPLPQASGWSPFPRTPPATQQATTTAPARRRSAAARLWGNTRAGTREVNHLPDGFLWVVRLRQQVRHGV